MKQFKKEFLTQHLLVLCAMSIIGALVRNEAMQYGVDTFSCNLTFVILNHHTDGCLSPCI